MRYFAYGSNLDWVQMCERRSSARFGSIAQLKDYRLAFNRYSKNRKCRVADAVPAAGYSIWGVVYDLDEMDLGKLDRNEDFDSKRAATRNSYNRKECNVFINGDDLNPLTVSIYFAQKEQIPPPPNKEYKGLIINGAKFWKLPEEYIKQL